MCNHCDICLMSVLPTRLSATTNMDAVETPQMHPVPRHCLREGARAVPHKQMQDVVREALCWDRSHLGIGTSRQEMLYPRDFHCQVDFYILSRKFHLNIHTFFSCQHVSKSHTEKIRGSSENSWLASFLILLFNFCRK